MSMDIESDSKEGYRKSHPCTCIHIDGSKTLPPIKCALIQSSRNHSVEVVPHHISYRKGKRNLPKNVEQMLNSDKMSDYLFI
jgi:hypothetical protein